MIGAIDVDLLQSLPGIVNSPYVKLDPAIYVLYYNALYYGLDHIHGPGNTLAQSAYMKVLEAVPAWLDASIDTDMDGPTAALTTWSAINSLDYQLSWSFHCKSCHHIKSKGIDHLDTVPAQTFEEESRRDILRYLYWQVLATDHLFRLFFGKPTVVSHQPQSREDPVI